MFLSDLRPFEFSTISEFETKLVQIKAQIVNVSPPLRLGFVRS